MHDRCTQSTSERTPTGASESPLLKDTASGGGGGVTINSIVTHKITLQAYTSNCSHKRGGGGCRCHCHHHYFGGRLVHEAGGGGHAAQGHVLHGAACTSGGVTCMEHIMCLCCGAGHVSQGGGGAGHAFPSQSLPLDQP